MAQVTRNVQITVTLDGLNRIWAAVSTAVDAWERNPKTQLRLIAMPISAAINGAVKDITKHTLPVEDAQLQAVLNRIVEKLKAYAAEISVSQEQRYFGSPKEFLNAWEKTVTGILKDIERAAPAVKQQPAYEKLIGRYAA